MIIIAGYSLTEAANRDAAVAAFQPIVERARSQSGCLDLHISADPLDAQLISFAPSGQKARFERQGTRPFNGTSIQNLE